MSKSSPYIHYGLSCVCDSKKKKTQNSKLFDLSRFILSLLKKTKFHRFTSTLKNINFVYIRYTTN